MPAYTPVDIPVNLPASPSLDHLVEEVAVAININGINHAVMMVTPDDLDDFAVGFLFGEGSSGTTTRSTTSRLGQ